jgi:hypothetical protein
MDEGATFSLYDKVRVRETAHTRASSRTDL